SGTGNGTVGYSVAANTGTSGRSGSLTIGGQAVSVTQSGATRIIGLSGSLAFGTVTVGSTSTKTLTINNTGHSTLTVSSVTGPAGFSGTWPSGTSAGGGSRAVTVTFAPTAAISYSGTVSVSGDQTSGTSTTAASGTGVIGPVTIVQDTFTD